MIGSSHLTSPTFVTAPLLVNFLPTVSMVVVVALRMRGRDGAAGNFIFRIPGLPHQAEIGHQVVLRKGGSDGKHLNKAALKAKGLDYRTGFGIWLRPTGFRQTTAFDRACAIGEKCCIQTCYPVAPHTPQQQSANLRSAVQAGTTQYAVPAPAPAPAVGGIQWGVGTKEAD
ncbi:hypothetical protein MKZ38_006837 [Zalerion maritima]|uniref:Uncharacterized protein n=1 Tax=Zalerion maritima TaxID=339359 RepID=A0AAD5RWE1_9PEZI|nr:hypothetical protein MKZ38_006837 [Zalerion maritima]